MNSRFDSEAFWSEAWVRHIENYLSAPPRTGIWIDSRFAIRGRSVVEIAGGSCRDARYLADRGTETVGTDFDQMTIEYLSKRFPDSNMALRREDAFSLSFADGRFDISFHNGFWVLFDKDEVIIRLLKEQRRVTSGKLIAIVHNAENPRLVERFRAKAASDDLYNIRFFSRQELLAICKSSGLPFASIKIMKFGGPVDRIYSLARRLPEPLARVVTVAIPRLYRLQPWSWVERVAVVLTCP